MTARRFELVAGPYGGLVDALAWDGSMLLFSVLPQDSLLRFEPATRQVSVFRPYWIRIRGLAFDRAGVLYGAQAGSRRIVRFDPDGSAAPIRARLDGHLHNCPEDLAIDARGRIWFSDPYDTLPPRGPDLFPLLDHASVLRLDRDGDDGDWRQRRMTFDTRYPRGVALSRDERTLYVVDSPLEGAGEVRAYPIQDDGLLGPGHSVYHVAEGGLDGLRVDPEGNLVVCGAEVWVVSPTGRRLAAYPTPEGRPAACAFGDPDQKTLYVSTTDGHLYRLGP